MLTPDSDSYYTRLRGGESHSRSLTLQRILGFFVLCSRSTLDDHDEVELNVHTISSNGIAPLGLQHLFRGQWIKLDNALNLNALVHSERFRNWKIEEVRQAIVKRKSILNTPEIVKSVL